MRTKNNLTKGMLIAAALLVSNNALAQEETQSEAVECVAPTNTPIIPDGVVASKDEMIAAQNAVKYFQSINLEYLLCLENKKTALDPEAEDSADKIAALDEAHAAAIKLEESVAAEFNEARKVFLEK